MARPMTTWRTLGAGFLLSAACLAGPATAESGRSLTVFAGIMTDNVWEDAVRFWQADYLSSGLVGVGLGREFARRGRVSYGIEGQFVGHFGEQDNLEFNLPLVVRYHREGQRLPAFESVAFGIGLSWASEKPATEVARDGDASQLMAYWMLEAVVDMPKTELDAVFRLHHRSDAYGLFPTDSGSNALVIGVRHGF